MESAKKVTQLLTIKLLFQINSNIRKQINGSSSSDTASFIDDEIGGQSFVTS